MEIKAKAFRILDANINRASEGLRVMEEAARFVLDKNKQTKRLKELRSKVRKLGQGLNIPLQHRNSREDVGRDSFTPSEANRLSLADIFSASAKRTQEALRVLEEFSKLVNLTAAKKFKKIRFAVYAIEKLLYDQIDRFE
ncbi:MAG: thiamine-phosphate pyrophosphorylase [Candidatus Margulisbacteria bacterium]|nr:thiamine-phosphate pyrophosphorylase [Candidatus Margulisiibacteriota bacterium]